MRSLLSSLIVAQLCFQVAWGVSELLVANVTGTKRLSITQTCINNNQSDPIAWITPVAYQYSQPLQVINFARKVHFDWKLHGWTWTYFYHGFHDPVADYSWEAFPIEYTEGLSVAKDQKPTYINSVTMLTIIHFSYMGPGGGRIYLCNDKTLATADCLVYTLAQRYVNRSVLRKCSNGSTPMEESYWTEGCTTLRHETHRSVINREGWNHIKIHNSDNRTLEVIINNVTTMKYNSDVADLYNYTNIHVDSFEPAFWKYHRYLMYHDNPPSRHMDATIDVQSQHLCLSFLTANNGNMSVEIYSASNTTRRLFEQVYGYVPGTYFDYRTFYATLPSKGKYVVRVKVLDKLVNMRNMLIYDDCDAPVTTHVHSSTLTHTLDDDKRDKRVGVYCSSLHSSEKLSLTPVSWRERCTSEACTSCNKLHKTERCPHRMACNKRGCYCSHGFKGDYCQQACTLSNQTSPEPKLTVYADRVKVELQLRCDDWNEDVVIFMNALCTSEWCEDKVNAKGIIPKDLADGFSELSLQPYTSYSLTVRKQHFRHVETLLTRNFTTKPITPHPITFVEVYAKSETNLSIRWRAPYPPTGELESFRIDYQYIDAVGKYSPKRSAYSGDRCRLWTDMFCATLENLRRDTLHEISVAAKNKNVTLYGHATLIRDTTTIQPPDAPLNVSGYWDDRRFLILEWQHPDKSNAPHLVFKGDVDRQQFSYAPAANLTYTFNTTVRCTSTNHYLNGILCSTNEFYSSPLVPFHFSCPVFKPVFGQDPILTHIANNSLTVLIPTVDDAELESSLYVIIWTNQSSELGDCKSRGREMYRFLSIENQACWLLGRFAKENYASIAGMKHVLTFAQAPSYNLQTEYFRVGILIVNKYQDQTSHNWYNLRYGGFGESRERFNYWYVIAFLGVCVLLGFAWWYRRCFRSKKSTRRAKKELIPLSKRGRDQNFPRTRAATNVHFKIPTDSDTLIPVDKLHEYVKAAILGDKLDAQYATNEYGVAYEPVRTEAKLKPRFASADFIKVGDCDKAYIAMKDPSEKTTYDFWSMVLVEGVRDIALMTSVQSIRKNTAKCYWPTMDGNKEITIKDIRIAAVEEKRHYNFVKRSFLIRRGNSESAVTQHHFLDWPGREVPIYPHSLLPFVKDILEIPYSADHPILVHCSADIDRSGTIILIDICLRQAIATQHVDAFCWLNDLREQRSCLLNNAQQYKLVHLVVVEYFCPIKTTYSCTAFPAAFAKLDDATLEKTLRHVDDSHWHEHAFHKESAVYIEVDDSKNRSSHIYPNQYGVLYLIPRTEGDSCYINAVSVDGFCKFKQFVATQHPMSNTVDDFWRLAAGEDIQLLVSLQTDYDVAFWKRGGDFVTPGGTSVEHIEYQEHEACVIHTLHVQLKKGKKKSFQLVEFAGWDVGESVPRRLASLLSLWKLVKDRKLGDSKVLIMCRNGANACGLYIAMANVLDRMEDEQVVDVSMAVRIVRRSRRQFVSGIVQMKALYQLAALHLEEFKKYSNFIYN